MMKYYVYSLINPVTQLPFYIGKGCGQRWAEHLKETAQDITNPHKFHTIQHIRKQGYEPTVEFLYYTDDEQHAYDVEVEYIKLFGRKGLDEKGILTNICVESIPPSKLGVKEKEATRKKKSDSAKKRFKANPRGPLSEETKEKLSLANRGKPNLALKGKPSPHGKDEMRRRALLGVVSQKKKLEQIKADPEQYEHWLAKKADAARRARKAKAGKPVSIETRTRLSAALSGKRKPQITCPHCEVTGGVPAMRRFHFDNCKSLRTFA